MILDPAETENALHFDDDGTPIAEVCPTCESTNTYFDFDHWKCEDCSTVWEDSPEKAESDRLAPQKILEPLPFTPTYFPF